MTQEILTLTAPSGSTFKIIKYSDIIIGEDRQRKEFKPEDLSELSHGMKLRGLMHAVVLRPTELGLKLVAGERRIRGAGNLHIMGDTFKFDNVDIPDGYIPFVDIGELDELQAEEAELEENLHRANLTWQEQSAATERLHRLRSRQAQAEGRLHSVADTSRELKGRSDGAFQQAVRNDIIVAKHLHIPEVAKAKNTTEALKVILRREEQTKNVQHAAAIGKTYSASVHELHNVNCLDWMSNCAPSQFDVILTDPPYGMGADTFGDGGGGRLANNEHHYKDDYQTWQALMQQWCGLSFRVAKPQAHAYVFCDIDNFHELKRMMQAAGWFVTRTPFICTKPNSGRVPHPTEGPRRQWEMLLYAIKGHKNTTAIHPDVITTTADSGLTHGAQKPVALFEDLLKRSVRPGDTILDSFVGSGTIFPAAQTFKCKAVGLEMNPEYFAIAQKRLSDLTLVQTGDGVALAGELKALLG